MTTIEDLLLLCDNYAEAESNYDVYAGRHWPERERAAIRTALERALAEREALLKDAANYLTDTGGAPRLRAEIEALISASSLAQTSRADPQA